MCIISVVSLILVLIGAINCGLVGFFNYNFISSILGGPEAGTYSIWGRIVFSIIGLAGIWGLSFLIRIKSLCCYSHKCNICCSDKDDEHKDDKSCCKKNIDNK